MLATGGAVLRSFGQYNDTLACRAVCNGGWSDRRCHRLRPCILVGSPGKPRKRPALQCRGRVATLMKTRPEILPSTASCSWNVPPETLLCRFANDKALYPSE
jgi:hypothetical protein